MDSSAKEIDVIPAAHPYFSKYCKTSLWNWMASALDFDQVKLAFAFFRASAFIFSSGPPAPVGSGTQCASVEP